MAQRYGNLDIWPQACYNGDREKENLMKKPKWSRKPGTLTLGVYAVYQTAWKADGWTVRKNDEFIAQTRTAGEARKIAEGQLKIDEELEARQAA
jgi:hypothetical protein